MLIHALKMHAAKDETINQLALVCLVCLEIHMLNAHVNWTKHNVQVIRTVQFH